MSHLDRVLAASRSANTTTPEAGVVVFSREDIDLIMALAGCSLDEKPGQNWVERSGGLPDYICRIARAVKRSGKTTSQAVAIAVSRVKKWSTGTGVDTDTQAKAVKALAGWEALKAKNKTRKLALAAPDREVLCLSASYNTDIVRRAFESREREARKAWRVANPGASYEDGPGHLWVRELWTDFLIVDRGYGTDATTYKVTYTVDANNEVSFGEPQEVKTTYVVVDSGDLVGDELSDADLQRMLDLTPPGPSAAALSRVLALAAVTASPFGAKVKAKPFGAKASAGKASAGKDRPAPNTKAKRYADPGYQADGAKRYALDTAAQVRAAWSYINQRDNAGNYSPANLVKVKAAIKAAAKQFGITISETGRSSGS